MEGSSGRECLETPQLSVEALKLTTALKFLIEISQSILVTLYKKASFTFYSVKLS